MIKLKDILNETQSKQPLHEGKITELINTISFMATNEVEKHFQELIKFMDIEEIEKDLPKVSITDVKSNLVKSVIDLQTSNKTNESINEGLSDFIISMKNKVEDLINNITRFIQGISKIPGMVKNLKYIKNIRGFLDYYSTNMTNDGTIYNGINNQMINFIKKDVSEGIFTNNKSISAVFSMMFVVMLMTIMLSACTFASIPQSSDQLPREKQYTTQTVDTTSSQNQKTKNLDIKKIDTKDKSDEKKRKGHTFKDEERAFRAIDWLRNLKRK